ncbi:hypothetical protein FKR81_13395 [Lentzea tibetensis]|uniref:Uncharacterized protein n=1 Tax=Lentzea tibetensis TaxID=2591470 RepID=A0A563EWI6_9PSEU|nr:hypothetical protein [Lentzea tibetensis]TWP51841.1 hypothetical protein FKR81_13395 [Lentzea tibetensis]
MNDPVDNLVNEAGTPDRPPAEPPRRRRWVPLAAAAAAVLVAGGAYLVTRPQSSGSTESDRPFGFATAQAGSEPAAPLVVREGTEVRATGRVVAQSGKPARFCAPAPTFAIASPQHDCPFGVPVVGVDVNQLSPDGTAQLRGVWRGGVLTVAEQKPPAAATVPSDPFGPPPCSPPSAGWESPGEGDDKELTRYVQEQHPDRFRRPWVSYPGGVPATTMDMASAARVLVVEVVSGDPAEEGRALRSRYSGNLCVVSAPGRPSLADQESLHAKANEVLHELMRDPANGIYTSGGVDSVEVELVMVTPALQEKLAKIGGLALRPWLRPVA